jgi:carbamoyltransferase
VLINTSFNVRGEPIVCTPADAYRCFMGTNMDVLVLENQVIFKHEQPTDRAPDREKYLAQFQLD